MVATGGGAETDEGDLRKSKHALGIESPWDREPAAVSSRASSRGATKSVSPLAAGLKIDKLTLNALQLAGRRGHNLKRAPCWLEPRSACPGCCRRCSSPA